MTGGGSSAMTKEQQQFAMTKRGKLYNDKEGKAGVSVGKKYKYEDVGDRVCDCRVASLLAMTGEEVVHRDKDR